MTRKTSVQRRSAQKTKISQVYVFQHEDCNVYKFLILKMILNEGCNVYKFLILRIIHNDGLYSKYDFI